MASPFSMFRKSQKHLMVVLMVLAVFAFVIAPSLMQMSDRQVPGGGGQKTEVSWAGGTLNTQQLAYMQGQEQLAVRFLTAAMDKCEEAGGNPPQELAQKRGNRWVFSFIPTTDPNFDQRFLNRQTLRTLVLSKKAEKMGINLDDEWITLFLYKLTDDTVEFSRVGDELLQSSTGGRMTMSQLYDELRMHLEGFQVTNLAFRLPEAPGESWAIHEQLNRRVEAEILPLKVENFLPEVKGEPTTAEKTTLYEKYQAEYSYPGKPEPGFTAMRKLAFQYIKVNYEDFEKQALEAELAKITDEAIEAHYERNKSQYKIAPAEDKPAEDKPAGDKPAEDKPAEDKPAEDKPAEDKPAEDKPAEDKPADDKPAEDKPAEDKPAEDKPAEDKPAEDKPAEDKPAEDKPAEDKPAEDKPAEEQPATPDAGNDSRASLRSRTRFVSIPLLDDQPPADADEAPESTPADDTKAAAADADDDAPAPESPAAPVAETTETEQPPTTTAPATPVSPDEQTNEEQPPQPEAPVQYKPLDDELREEIRQDLAKASATVAAEAKRNAAVKAITSALTNYSNDYASWKIKEESEAKKPEQPNFETLATAALSTVSKTDFLDAFEMQETELGKTVQSLMTGQGNQPQTVSMVQMAYAQNVPEYSPSVSMGVEDQIDSTYVYWKVGERPDKKLTYAEAEEDVIKAWKTAKARELALEEGKKMADKISATITESMPAGETIKQVYPNDADEVIETGEFSWLTEGSVPFGGPPRLDEIAGVEGITNEFMKDVFGLNKVGDATAIMNQAGDTVYVVRLAKEAQTEKALRESFMTARFSFPAMFISQQENSQRVQQWILDIEREMGVDVPDQGP